MEEQKMTREQYLEYRQQDDQAAILAAYFGDKTQQELDTNNFTYLMFAAIEDDKNLKDRIDNVYPEILTYYDKLFSLNFLIKDYGGEGNRILLMMY
jgi:hypothetical protein